MRAKQVILLLSACLVCATALAESGAEEQLTVLRQNVNLRAKPSIAAEVVAQVSAPEKLTVKSVTDEWVEVLPPPHAELWVLGDYVRDGVIQCNTRVNVRAGAGINFNIVGQLTNGAAVSVRGTHADWIKIAPPESTSLWVARSMVELAPAGTAESAATESAAAVEAAPAPEPPPPTDEPRPEAPPTPAAPLPTLPPPAPASEPLLPSPPPAPHAAPALVKPPADLDLHPAKPQGQWRQYEGVLRPRNFIFGAPSRYRLAQDRAGVEATICHVRGNEAQLRALLNRRMVISGREYWVKRPDTHPVLVPERIVLK